MKIPTLKQIWQYFWNLPPVEVVVNWTKETSLPGFFKVPIYDVLVFIRNELGRNILFTKANAIAYSFFLSLFPSIIVLLTLLPFLSDYLLARIPGGHNFMEILEYEIHLVMPGNAGDLLFSTVEDITTRPRAGLLSLGFLMAIYFASNGMQAMMSSFSKTYEKTFKQRGALRERMIAIFLTFLLGLLLIASVLLVITGNLIINYLAEFLKINDFDIVLITVFRYVTMVALFYAIISVIYRFGVPVRVKFSFFSPGTTLATILSILSSLAFSFYIENFNTYNKLYGSIGSFIVIMLWIQINSLILLIGFELNASIAVNRDLKLERKDDE